MAKTYAEINDRIARGRAVVLTKEEYLGAVQERGIERCAREVDVVTTGTFGPMCSSGAFLNLGHTKPRIKIGGGNVTLNGVPAYAGIAAVDVYLGATAIPDGDLRNRNHPGTFRYGGGHVIHDLLAGREISLAVNAYGTDCYPRKKIKTTIRLDDINEAILCNPRNAYQNYNCGVNLSRRTIYTYMGVLRPNLGNANYCSACQLSPLFNDPLYRTIGVGTRIFLGGGVGYVFSKGTQHNPEAKRAPNGTPTGGAGTLAVTGDLKWMRKEWLLGVSFKGYGPTIRVGIGVPIPVLDEEMATFLAVTDSDLSTQVVDYSSAYPDRKPESLGQVTYSQLRSGRINIKGKSIPTTNLSLYGKAVKISEILREWITEGKMKIAEPLELLPSYGSGYTPKPLQEKSVRVKSNIKASCKNQNKNLRRSK